MTQSTKILIVDDDAPSRYVKSRLLARDGHVTVEACSGAQALELVAAELPALVVLDVHLGDMSGLDVCREIKARFPQCLVLHTSAAFVDVSDRALALDVGADGYLVEPIEPAELLASARALLRIHRAEQDVRRINEDLELIVAERTRELADANRRLAHEAEERRKAELILWHAQKLDLISRFTGGVAHDFNNLLTIIAGSLDLMRYILTGQSTSPVARVLKLLTTAETAAMNGALLTKRLLAFARRAPSDAVATRISDLTANWRALLTRAVGENVRLEITCSDDIWTCMVDPSQLEAAVVNLVVNAKDALAEGGTVRVAATNETIDGLHESAASIPPGDFVRIAVSDTGIGMGPDILDHVFEPFFTTKPVGRGSGLGLSQVYGFVRQSGGHIEVKSAPGAGTTVTLLFPRLGEGTVSPQRQGEQAPAERGSNETVLVVDDNQEVRDVTVALVVSLGYQAVSAANGNEALEIIESGDGVDLIVTDIVMPDIDGFELARRVHSLRPGLPILMTSGYTAQWAAEKPMPQNFTVLRKPYRSGELASHIRAAIDKERVTATAMVNDSGG